VIESSAAQNSCEDDSQCKSLGLAPKLVEGNIIARRYRIVLYRIVYAKHRVETLALETNDESPLAGQAQGDYVPSISIPNIYFRIREDMALDIYLSLALTLGLGSQLVSTAKE
jgi:hypothetical protein